MLPDIECQVAVSTRREPVSQAGLAVNGVGTVCSDERAADVSSHGMPNAVPRTGTRGSSASSCPARHALGAPGCMSVFAQRLMHTWQVGVLQKQDRQGAQRESDWFILRKWLMRLHGDTPQQAASSRGPGDPLSWERQLAQDKDGHRLRAATSSSPGAEVRKERG